MKKIEILSQIENTIEPKEHPRHFFKALAITYLRFIYFVFAP